MKNYQFKYKDLVPRSNTKKLLYVNGINTGDIVVNPNNTIKCLTISDLSEIGNMRMSDLIIRNILSIEISSNTLTIHDKIITDSLIWKISADNNNTEPLTISLAFFPSAIDWNLRFSIHKLFEIIRLDLVKRGTHDMEYDQSNPPCIKIRRRFIDFDTNLKQLYQNEVRLLENLVHGAITEISSSENLNAVINTFDFPSEIKEACEQYLIYFSKFLSDLGINADTSIETTDQGSIFKVVPKDSKEALSKIREALDVYLNLPGVPDLENQTSEFNNVSVQQLASQVFHLKSQLMLAKSAIQLKDATINSLNLTVYNQNKLIGDKKDEEEVLDGLVTIKKYDSKGLSINLAELFRRMKRILD